jgi:predicted nucleic acid-binding protein
LKSADTNVLVRLLTRDTPREAKQAEEFVATGAWVSLLTLAEAIWVLKTSYAANTATQIEAVALVLNNRNLLLQDTEVAESALRRFIKSPALGFSDCLMLEIARKAGHLPLGTFDRRLAKEPDTSGVFAINAT